MRKTLSALICTVMIAAGGAHAYGQRRAPLTAGDARPILRIAVVITPDVILDSLIPLFEQGQGRKTRGRGGNLEMQRLQIASHHQT